MHTMTWTGRGIEVCYDPPPHLVSRCIRHEGQLFQNEPGRGEEEPRP